MNPHSTNKTKEKTPSKINRQRDVLRLLSPTANAPTPHWSGKNARSHGLSRVPDLQQWRCLSRGIGLVPLDPAVWILVHWFYRTHEKMSHRHFLTDTSYALSGLVEFASDLELLTLELLFWADWEGFSYLCYEGRIVCDGSVLSILLNWKEMVLRLQHVVSIGYSIMTVALKSVFN